MDFRCIGCNKKPHEIEEYVEAAAVEDITPEQYVSQEEGTLNRENGHFACTPCYIKMGMPSSPRMGGTMKHLWEIDHPYYCNEGNYFARESVQSHYDSWANFIDEDGDADFDMNLVFRWDWTKADVEENGLDRDTLFIFWMGQRKGLYRYSTILITDDDESAVKEWLTLRWNHLKLLWEGISS